MKTNSVENRIREVAEKPISGRLNLVQYKKEKAKALKHKDVCKQIVEFADGNPYMPIYAILACGVAADAFKNSTFDKGYTKFNGAKAGTCYKMARAYNEKMGIKGQPNDVVWRLVARYYPIWRTLKRLLPRQKLSWMLMLVAIMKLFVQILVCN